MAIAYIPIVSITTILVCIPMRISEGGRFPNKKTYTPVTGGVWVAIGETIAPVLVYGRNTITPIWFRRARARLPDIQRVNRRMTGSPHTSA